MDIVDWISLKLIELSKSFHEEMKKHRPNSFKAFQIFVYFFGIFDILTDLTMIFSAL